MSIGGFLWTLGAQAWRTRSCCNINICIVYQLPTCWEFTSVKIIHWRVSVRPTGAGFGNIHFLIHILILDRSCQHLGIYILDISCQLLGDMCQLEGFCPRAQLSGAQLSTLKKVESWAPGPNCPPPKSGQLGPGQLGPGAQLSALKKWTVGPQTVRPWSNV